MCSGWESALADELMPRFEKDAGSGYAEGEAFDEIDLDFFTERSGNDIIENGNKVGVACSCSVCSCSACSVNPTSVRSRCAFP